MNSMQHILCRSVNVPCAIFVYGTSLLANPLVATSESDDTMPNNIQGDDMLFIPNSTNKTCSGWFIDSQMWEWILGIVPSTLTLTLIPLIFLVPLVPWTGCRLATFFRRAEMPRCKFTADILVFHLGEELQSLGKQPGNYKKDLEDSKTKVSQTQKTTKMEFVLNMLRCLFNLI